MSPSGQPTSQPSSPTMEPTPPELHPVVVIPSSAGLFLLFLAFLAALWARKKRLDRVQAALDSMDVDHPDFPHTYSNRKKFQAVAPAPVDYAAQESKVNAEESLALPLREGDVVDGEGELFDATGERKRGKVTRVRLNCTFDVYYDDGTSDLGVERSKLRRIETSIPSNKLHQHFKAWENKNKIAPAPAPIAPGRIVNSRGNTAAPAKDLSVAPSGGVGGAGLEMQKMPVGSAVAAAAIWKSKRLVNSRGVRRVDESIPTKEDSVRPADSVQPAEAVPSTKKSSTKKSKSELKAAKETDLLAKMHEIQRKKEERRNGGGKKKERKKVP